MRVAICVPLALVFSSAFGQVFSFEATSLYPEQEGWQREYDALHPVDRWLEAGWFFQRSELIVAPGQPTTGEDDLYRYPLTALAGAGSFFLDWIMQTDGPRDGFPDVAPAALVASGYRGIRYHFTIAEDQIRLIDSHVDVYLFDIEPGVPHHYRLEIDGTEIYRFYIDNALVFSDVPVGPYPTADSVLGFMTRAAGRTCMSRWDFIRFGVPPQPGSGDVNCDGRVDNFDIDPFILALSDPAGYQAACPACDIHTADANADGRVDNFDIDAFVGLLSGG